MGTPRRDPSQSKQDQIDAELRSQIVTGQLRPGQRLPTWDQLESRFGVSRLTIERGLAGLREDGFIVGNRSRGTSVVATPPHLYQIGLALPFWTGNPNTIPRFWQTILRQTQAFAASGPYRFSLYPGLDWGSPDQLLDLAAEDSSRHRIAGIIAVSHARFPVQRHDVIRKSGVPIVAITAVVNDPAVHTIGPDLSSFITRAISLLVDSGKRRVAILGDFQGPHSSELQNLLSKLDHAGLETRPHWCGSIPWGRPQWAEVWVQTLMRLPKGDRPDAFLIADEHIADSAAKGLARLTDPGKVPLVAQYNFPADPGADSSVVRLGFDIPKMISLAIKTIETLREGGEPPTLTLMPALLESEFLAARGM